MSLIHRLGDTFIKLHLCIALQAQFNHVGTVSEFLYHMCDNVLLRNAYQFHIQDLKVEGENLRI